MRILPIITLNKIKKVLTKIKELVKPSEYKLINFQLVNSYQISYPLYNLPPTDIIDVLFQSSGANGRNGLGGGGGAFCHIRIRNPHLYSSVYYYQFYDDFRINKMNGSYVRFSAFRLFSDSFRGAYIALNMNETDFLTNFPYIELKNVVKGGDGASSNNNGESVSTTIELLDRTIYIFSKGGNFISGAGGGGGAAVLGEGNGGLYGGGGSGYGNGAPGCLIIYHYRKIGG
jgi:hypothetical protein